MATNNALCPNSRPPDISIDQVNQQRSSLYSDKLKTNVTWDNRLKRNVLEITLEKVDDMMYDDLEYASVHRLFKTLGINTENEIEGYFQRNKSIHVWLKNGISLERFCKNESIRVAQGVKTGFIRPEG